MSVCVGMRARARVGVLVNNMRANDCVKLRCICVYESLYVRVCVMGVLACVSMSVQMN